MKKNYLTNRLREIFLPKSKTSFFEHFRDKPEKVESVLNKLLIIDDDRVTVTGGAWRFNYRDFLKDKGYKLGREIGFNEGVIYELTKIN